MVQKRLATGAFANAEDVIRRALEVLAEKIERALEQVAGGRACGPEEGRRRLAPLREAHLQSGTQRPTAAPVALSRTRLHRAQTITFGTWAIHANETATTQCHR
jgi:Arc/MetJ-type ribon-helix-helix transcriptional regulator